MLSYIWTNGALGSILGALVLAGLCGTAHGLRRGSLRAAATGGALALPVTIILGATLLRYGFPSTFDLAAGVHWTSGGWLRFTTDFGHSEEILLNILLFVPAGLVGAVASRRPVLVLMLLAVLSVVIEFVQGVVGLGTADLSDLLSNTIGAGAGSLAGAVIACLWVPGARRRPYWELGALLVVTVAAAALVPVGAAHRQQAVEDALAARFAGHTVSDYKRWSATGQLGDRVFAVNGIFSSGAQQQRDRAVVRYPTSFMGIDQCITAIWTATGVGVARHSGGFCDRFMG